MKTNTKTVKAQLKSLKTQLKTMKEQIKALKGKAPKKVKHVARPGDYTVPRQNDGGQWGDRYPQPGDYTVPRQNDGGQWGDRYPQPQPRTPQFGDRWIEG